MKCTWSAGRPRPSSEDRISSRVSARVHCFTAGRSRVPGAQVTLSTNAEVAFCRSDHQAVVRHMSELAREMERQSGKERFTSGRTCHDCVETIREAKLIQTSLLPTPGVSATTPWTSRSASYPSPTGGRLCRLLPLTGRSHRHLPRGRGREGLVGSHVCRARDGSPARDSQIRDGYRAGSFPVERASGAATHRGRFCSTLYALFNPVTRELIFSNAGMPLPLLVSGSACRQLGEGGLLSGMFPGSTYGRHVVQLVPGDCVLFATDGLHELRNGEGVEFCSAHMEEAGQNAGTNRQPNRRTSFSTARWPLSDGRVPHDDIGVVVLKVLR
jgi:hypothetical protein